MLAQGFLSEAEAEFREAIALNPSNAEAHAGLASVLEAENNEAGARSEAEEALRLRQFPEPLLVLAKLDLRDNRAEAAAENIDQSFAFGTLQCGRSGAQTRRRSQARAGSAATAKSMKLLSVSRILF